MVTSVPIFPHGIERRAIGKVDLQIDLIFYGREQLDGQCGDRVNRGGADLGLPNLGREDAGPSDRDRRVTNLANYHPATGEWCDRRFPSQSSGHLG